MGGLGRSPQPPEANGDLGAKGLVAKPPAAGDKGVWERNPQRSVMFMIFQQNNHF